MPLVALDRTTGRRFVLDGVPDPETQLGGRDIRCPVCETPLALRRTPGCPPSFRHTEASSCEGVSHPESPEHDGAKRQVRQLAAEALRPLTSAPLEYEVWVPEAGRLADLLQLFRCGWGIAYEVQLTPIAAPELARRTDAYARAGLDVHWFLGADADTPENRAWALRRTGITTRLDEHATVPGVGGGVLWGAPLAPRAWLRRSLHRFFEIWRRHFPEVFACGMRRHCMPEALAFGGKPGGPPR